MPETTPAEMPPFAQTIQMLLGSWVGYAVAALAKLGVPDHIDDTPRSADEVAAKIGAKPDLLYRLMRATAAVGVLAETPDKKFVQTPMSATLRTDAVPGLRHVAMFCTDSWHVKGWGELAETVKTGELVATRLGYSNMWAYLGERPEEAENFNRGMTNMSTADGPAVCDAYDFSGIKTIADIGGGHGLLLATILQRNPGLRGTLYDQPSVIAGAPGGPTDAVKDRVALVGGDMFQAVPQGMDAYIMKYIIHDWMDEPSTQILKACRAAVNPGGKLLVVDMVVPGPGEMHMGKIADLEMMLFPNGKERTEAEFRELFAKSGWKLNRVIPTASHTSVIEGTPA
jgi:hypothetical protein